MAKCRLLLISRQIILREALAGLLDKQPGLHVVGNTACCEEALALAAENQPDLLLVDSELALSELQTL
ncbi:MAG TPA: hypothetical protein VHS59_10785, partial [Bacillota bacterium]|nr:hypothetical protein [Bacillota bacterium]